ncbi:zinc finger MYM-type protein 1-like protein [Tanacetum coccineum]
MNKHNLNIDEDNQNMNNDDQNAYVEGDFGEVSGDGNINDEGVDAGNSGANGGDEHIDYESANCDNSGANYYSEDQYAVSIKEDTAYPFLHSPKTTEEERSIRRDLNNSTNNVLIPLDSWTSGLLVYRLPLSDALIVTELMCLENIERIKNEDMRAHYLGPGIQNELITLLARAIKTPIINKMKQAKYFSVILYCTLDISHEEQMSLIISYVDVSSSSIIIEESFLGFLNVYDTTGQGLFDVLQSELKLLDLDINDVRGQGYDNGSNMKGKHQRVQRKLLDLNSRAFHTLCSSHSLNLALCDMVKTCPKAKNFLVPYEKFILSLETRFSKALESAKEISIEMNIDPVFVRKCEIIRKRHLD